MKAGDILGRVYLVALFCFVFAPIAASFVFSFNSDRFPTLPLGHFTTEWYARAFSRPELWQAIANSLMVAGCTAVLSTFIGFATAYTDFRYGFRFKQAYLALALLPPTMPLVILGLAFVPVTLSAPKGIGGLFDRVTRTGTRDRKGAPLGPDDGSLQEQEAQP